MFTLSILNGCFNKSNCAMSLCANLFYDLEVDENFSLHSVLLINIYSTYSLKDNISKVHNKSLAYLNVQVTYVSVF